MADIGTTTRYAANTLNKNSSGRINSSGKPGGTDMLIQYCIVPTTILCHGDQMPLVNKHSPDTG